MTLTQQLLGGLKKAILVIAREMGIDLRRSSDGGKLA